MSKTEVLYNDTCPICSREIKHYDRLAQSGELPVTFAPLTQAAADWGLEADTAARQLHVRRSGETLAGADAFIALWEEIPRYRWLARLCKLPIIYGIVRVIYNRLAAPMLFAMHKRRQAKSG